MDHHHARTTEDPIQRGDPARAGRALRLLDADAGAADREGHRQHGRRRRQAGLEGARRRHRAARHDHRPEAEHAPRAQVDRPVQGARGDAGRRRGDAARRARLRVPRSADVGRDPADPRLPRAQPARRSTAAATTRWACASRSSSPRSTTTRSIRSAASTSRSRRPRRADEEAFALLEALGMPFSKEGRSATAAATSRNSLEGDTWPRFHSASASSGHPSTRPAATPAAAAAAAPRGVPQVRRVPDLPARAGPQRLHPRHDEVELVDRMSMTDPVADFLTRLRNAAKAAAHDVAIPSSKLKRELARILKEQGYIEACEVEPPGAGQPGERDRGHAQVHRRPQAGDHRPRSASRGPASARTSTTPTSRGSRAGWAPRSSRPPRAS